MESKNNFLQDWVLSPDLNKSDVLLVSSFTGVEEFSFGL